ncbi:MAG: hypothetical protein ACYCXW_08640 [Solirubrobacteraceae bacterium]
MANLSSDDRPEQSTNATIKRLHDSSPRASRASGEEQMLADGEQTLADGDQTSGEHDQPSASHTM